MGPLLSTLRTRREGRHPGQAFSARTGARIVQDRGFEALGTVLYLGYVPAVSGTVGSLPGVVLFWFCRERPLLFAGLIAVMFVVGTFAARHVERKTGKTDPGCVVIDEMVGMMVALAPFARSSATVVAAFVAFRFFDITKPFPARQFEQRRGGLGIMLDDIVAAVYTWAAVGLASVMMSG